MSASDGTETETSEWENLSNDDSATSGILALRPCSLHRLPIVDQNGSVTAADALLAFQQALSLAHLSMCRQSIAAVSPLPTTPDGHITASDALCIFQKVLSLPSCLDTLPPEEADGVSLRHRPRPVLPQLRDTWGHDKDSRQIRSSIFTE